YWMPALLIKISNLPDGCLAFLLISWTSVGSETFALTKVVLSGSRRAIFSPAVSSLPMIKTCAPYSAHAVAIALPIPFDPPATMRVWLLNFCVLIYISLFHESYCDNIYHSI